MEDIVTVESGNDINHSLALTEWLICFLCFLTNLERQNPVCFSKRIVADPGSYEFGSGSRLFSETGSRSRIPFQVSRFLGLEKKFKVHSIMDLDLDPDPALRILLFFRQ